MSLSLSPPSSPSLASPSGRMRLLLRLQLAATLIQLGAAVIYEKHLARRRSAHLRNRFIFMSPWNCLILVRHHAEFLIDKRAYTLFRYRWYFYTALALFKQKLSLLFQAPKDVSIEAALRAVCLQFSFALKRDRQTKTTQLSKTNKSKNPQKIIKNNLNK